ncbi:DUF350 domain-containing protein [Leeia oryzae]|uniref:DUF350 domain-containing protein n=1 Tax=Leeia oryzae TaxID=356662 RepID=UPI0003715637|nr:DUF350 domain-containing protein [Leeia oryzae]
MMHLEGFYSYLLYLLSGFALLAAFVVIYTKVTPIDEIDMICKGKASAALSFGGAFLGFSLTLASSVLHSNTYYLFLVWGIIAMLVQLLTYVIISRLIPSLNTELDNNNVAMGGLAGTISLTVGILNAACLS